MPLLANRCLLVFWICVTGLLTSTARGESPSSSAFGAPLRLSEPTELGAVLAAPERFGDQRILLRGTLVDVCQKKGCWTVLRQDGHHVRIRFEDYGFFLPKDVIGVTALAEGVVTVRTISEKEARHYEEEARDGDPARIVGPQREVAFTASGVRLIPPSPPRADSP